MSATPQPTVHMRRPNQANPLEAARAIYIDFEGLMDESPALLGLLVDGVFEQVVLDPSLASAGNAKGLATRSGARLFAELLDRATRESRRICAFSRHERNIAREYFGVALDPFYLDGHKLAPPVVEQHS